MGARYTAPTLSLRPRSSWQGRSFAPHCIPRTRRAFVPSMDLRPREDFALPSDPIDQAYAAMDPQGQGFRAPAPRTGRRCRPGGPAQPWADWMRPKRAPEGAVSKTRGSENRIRKHLLVARFHARGKAHRSQKAADAGVSVSELMRAATLGHRLPASRIEVRRHDEGACRAGARSAPTSTRSPTT